MPHYTGRFLGTCMIIGASVGGYIAWTGVEFDLSNGQIIISTTESRTAQKEKQNSEDIQLNQPEIPKPQEPIQNQPNPPSPQLSEPDEPPSKHRTQQEEFDQPNFHDNPRLYQPINSSKLLIPIDWEEKKDQESSLNSQKFGCIQFQSKKINKRYQGELYLFEDGSWIKIEKSLNKVSMSSSKSKQEHVVVLFLTSNKKSKFNRLHPVLNTELKSQDEGLNYTQGNGNKTFEVSDDFYIFSDLLR
ncbi:MAG: hypothetical protein ACRCXZ_04910 [Patescibacteria group bacterium]